MMVAPEADCLRTVFDSDYFWLWATSIYKQGSVQFEINYSIV